jgi:hypothetical protein
MGEEWMLVYGCWPNNFFCLCLSLAAQSLTNLSFYGGTPIEEGGTLLLSKLHLLYTHRRQV